MAAILELRGVSCALGGKAVLRGVSLNVEAGETVVLLGRSGSGKTTLLRTVNGLVQADAGEVVLEGKRLVEGDWIRARRRMGYVIQDSGLFPHWTVKANIGLVPRLEEWPGDRVERRTSELLGMVGLDEALGRRYPRELSGGQKQRVGIARALAADPPLLLLDEPFAALDPITRLDLQRQFLELRRAQRQAALFVTHDIREALMLGTRIALLKDGAIDTLAPPREFLRAESQEARAFLAGLEDGWRRDGN